MGYLSSSHGIPILTCLRRRATLMRRAVTSEREVKQDMTFGRSVCQRVVSVVILSSALLGAQPVAADPPSSASTNVQGEPPSPSRSVSKTVAVPASAEECSYRQAMNASLPCVNLVTSTLSATTVTPPDSGVAAASTLEASSAESTGLRCVSGEYKCDAYYPASSWLGTYPCGTTYTGTWDTKVSDITGGTLWYSWLRTRFHGTLCQNVFWDSVDCSDYGGFGYSVTVDSCPTFNNGGGAPWNYTEATDNFHVAFAFRGFPFSSDHHQGQQFDVNANTSSWYS